MNITTLDLVTGIGLVTLILDYVLCMPKMITTPKDAVVKIGHYVIMNCSYSYVNDTCGRINWKHFKMGSDSGDYINIGGQLSSSFTSYISIIDSSAGNCNLRINATPSAAGRYECVNALPGAANAQLIVLENDPEVEIIKKSQSGTTALACSVNYYGNWAPKVQWGKIVGNSWTSVASNDSEKLKSPASSLIQIPSATFDSTGATEYFICNVTISKPEASDILIYPTYNWTSLKSGTTWGKRAEVESTTEGINQGSCGGYCIAFIISFISTCGLLVVTIYIYLKIRRMRNRE